jgi:hypothetical protein
VIVSQKKITYFFNRNDNANHHLGTGFFVPEGIRSSVKRVEIISARMSLT